MADRSQIEWTDATWNPVRGCSRVSEGCRFCYAEGVAARFSGEGQAYHGFADRDRPGSKWTGKVDVAWHLIDQPLRWARPRRIFVNSMSDLFHEALPAEEIATIFAVMVAAVHLRGHTMQVLTKRPERMREVLTAPAFWHQVNAEASMHVLEGTDALNRRSDDARATLDEYGPDNPPPGIWLGTSVENQAAANARIPDLLETPAARRFLSCEPMLGPVDLNRLTFGLARWHDALSGLVYYGLGAAPAGAHVDWVIAGGESGPNARPANPQWFRDLRDQCRDAAVPFFFKQWGEWCSVSEMEGPAQQHFTFEDGRSVRRIGKRKAGNTLDGRHHLEFPA